MVFLFDIACFFVSIIYCFDNLRQGTLTTNVRKNKKQKRKETKK